MDLNNAEIAVTTQHLIDIKDYRDYWLHLSDYSDMGEFLSACSDLFPGEKEPEYRYPKWENIPDTLVSREWLCPNFFEIRDALERLEEEETEFFISWSRSYGYDITTDDHNDCGTRNLTLNAVSECLPTISRAITGQFPLASASLFLR